MYLWLVMINYTQKACFSFYQLIYLFISTLMSNLIIKLIDLLSHAQVALGLVLLVLLADKFSGLLSVIMLILGSAATWPHSWFLHMRGTG